MIKTILLINPWIYDFAAFDLWLKPWGLLKISSILKESGFKVIFIDAMDRHHPLITKEVRDFPDGTGKFNKEEIEKPFAVKDIPKKYNRYGLSVESFREALPSRDIDFILVSSGMTYWYPGVVDAVKILKEKYIGAPIVLGGIYATIEKEHAKLNSGADYVIGNKELAVLSGVLGVECDFSPRNVLDVPIDYSWYKGVKYGVLRLSLGCPFNCSYCAQKKLSPEFMLKDEEKAFDEIKQLYGTGIRNYAFYDDALLCSGDYLHRYLKRIIKEGLAVHFHTPNGLHARYMTEETAFLMKKTNFINPVLSLEVSKDEKGKLVHSKVIRDELERAILYLSKAGYKKGEYMIYLMLGLPGTEMDEVKDSIEYVHSLGAKISLSEYSPIPGTTLGCDDEKVLNEPLLQNNSVFPTFKADSWDKVQEMKSYAHLLNGKL